MGRSCPRRQRSRRESRPEVGVSVGGTVGVGVSVKRVNVVAAGNCSQLFGSQAGRFGINPTGDTIGRLNAHPLRIGGAGFDEELRTGRQQSFNARGGITARLVAQFGILLQLLQLSRQRRSRRRVRRRFCGGRHNSGNLGRGWALVLVCCRLRRSCTATAPTPTTANTATIATGMIQPGRFFAATGAAVAAGCG